MQNRLLDAADVARYLNCCENTARKLMREMEHVVLHGGASHRMVRVTEGALAMWQMKNTVDPAPAGKGRKKAAAPRIFPHDGLDERGRIKRRTI